MEVLKPVKPTASVERGIDYLKKEQASIPEGHEFRFRLSDILEIGLKTIAQDSTDLAALNEIGVYHKFNGKAGNPFAVSNVLGDISADWITRGHWPGIWCTLYSPHYTYTSHDGDLTIGRLTLRQGCQLYDPAAEVDQKKWRTWAAQTANAQKFNKWDNVRNSQGKSMSDRVSSFLGAPNHYAFYEEMKFGAIIGYSDYMAVVIINENAIETIEAAVNLQHWISLTDC